MIGAFEYSDCCGDSLFSKFVAVWRSSETWSGWLVRKYASASELLAKNAEYSDGGKINNKFIKIILATKRTAKEHEERIDKEWNGMGWIVNVLYYVTVLNLISVAREGEEEKQYMMFEF